MTIKLSDAVILGDTLKRPNSNVWLSADGSCGCAFGGALLAAGVTPAVFHAEMNEKMELLASLHGSDLGELDCVANLWPWLNGQHLGHISSLYIKVHAGVATLEDIAAYIRSVEPQVQSPAALASVADQTHDGRTFARLDAMVEEAESRVS